MSKVTLIKSTSKESQKFKDWYAAAKAEDIYVYYIGFLGLEKKFHLIEHVKHVAWEYAVKGRVYLVQRRIGIDEFDYIAIKAKKYTRKLVPCNYHSRSNGVTHGQDEEN